MKILIILLLVVCAVQCQSQCPNYVNTNTDEIKAVVAMVESAADVQLAEDTISSLNVYYYASADKSTVLKFELLKAKREVKDTVIDMPVKVMRLQLLASAAVADKVFNNIKSQVKTCSEFKIRKALIRYADETAEIKVMAGGKKQITIY